jgi:hypothetical protein
MARAGLKRCNRPKGASVGQGTQRNPGTQQRAGPIEATDPFVTWVGLDVARPAEQRDDGWEAIAGEIEVIRCVSAVILSKNPSKRTNKAYY